MRSKKFRVEKADNGQWKIVAPNGRESLANSHEEAMAFIKASIVIAKRINEFERRFKKLAEAAQRRRQAVAGGEVRTDAAEIPG